MNSETTHSESSEDECFEDATEAIEYTDLQVSIDETKKALDLFINNRHEDAKKLLEPRYNQSVYYALGYGTICYLNAVITMEPDVMRSASEKIRECLKVCTRCRRRATFTENFRLPTARRSIYNDYSDLEAHAELCYAELSLLRSVMTILENENILAWIKAAMKIRECYNCYRECWKILSKRTTWQNEYIKRVFESGTRMGVGSFNLMISMMPQKALKLMDFFGYSGDRTFGLQQLYKASLLTDTLRAPLCTLTLISYYIILSLISGYGELKSTVKAQALLTPCLSRYPSSAIFLCLQGRVWMNRGEIDKAVNLYNEVQEIPNQWPKMLSIAYWELMWCYAFQGDWIMAIKYTEQLANTSNWSKATCYYLKAAFLLQCHYENPAPALLEAANKIMSVVPSYAQRIAGKSIPFEKFIIKKSIRYMENGYNLTFPALEVMLVWNALKLCINIPANFVNLLAILDKNIEERRKQMGSKNFSIDDFCLLLTIKGCCLRPGDTAQKTLARKCFEEVIKNAKILKIDVYLLPLCEMEMVYLNFGTQNWQVARKHLENAKSYKDYTLESRLQVRMQSAAVYIKTQENGIQEEELVFNTTEDLQDLDELTPIEGATGSQS